MAGTRSLGRLCVGARLGGYASIDRHHVRPQRSQLLVFKAQDVYNAQNAAWGSRASSSRSRSRAGSTDTTCAYVKLASTSPHELLRHADGNVCTTLRECAAITAREYKNDAERRVLFSNRRWLETGRQP